MKTENGNEGLDYEIVQSKTDNDVEVWTPDTNGAVIGIGKTREEAIKDAIVCLGLTVASLGELLI